MIVDNKPQWIPLSRAASQLDVSIAKLSGMVARREVKSKRTIRDRRLVLVDWDELQKLFELEDNQDEPETR